MPRRGENIYKRKDNRWEGRLKTGLNAMGKPIYKSVYARSYLDCKTKLKNISQDNTPSVHPVASSSLTFTDACQQWLFNIKSTVKSSTYAGYHYSVERYIEGYFGKKKAAEINRDMVDVFIAILLARGAKNGKTGLAVKTVNNILTMLKAIFCFLERQHAIKNPLLHIRLPKQEESGDTVLSRREWEHLSSVLTVYNDETAAAVAIALYTGLRIGELCALKKKDIDFNENIIHVQRTVQRIINRDDETGPRTRIIISKPKSVKSVRKIPIPDRLLEKLKAVCSGKKDETFILGIDGKKALEPRTLQYRFKAFLKKTGLREIHFHALRHTFATRCVEKNIDIKTLSEILGHASVKITLEKYVHSSMEFKRFQMNRLEEAV